MSIDDVKPTTLAGIKSLAKDLKRIQKIKHRSALDLAAQRAGHSNFEHARKLFAKDSLIPFDAKAGYVTVFWKNADTKESGRVTLGVPLSRPISNLVTVRAGWIGDRYLRGYKLEALDHLEMTLDRSRYEDALETARSAAYTLQFMDWTGLRSLNPALPDPIAKAFESLESRDHMSTWVIPGEPLQWVVLDEPYDKFDRSSWADKNQFAVKECYRNGLYRGGPTFATVFSSSVELADNAAEALATIHATKINVIKDVGVYDSRFRSPYDVASQAKPQPRTMPLPAGTVQDDSVAYGTLAGEKSSWRPNFTLPIEEHLKIGPVLAALLPIFESDDEDPLHEVKFDLCNWFFLEHGDAITPKIEAAYDGHNEDGADRKLREALDTPAGRVNAVRWVVDVLTRGYPSCKALDIQVAALRTSEKFTSSSA